MNLILRSWVYREEEGRAQRVHLHVLLLKETVAGAKPPQESQTRILATKALLKVNAKTSIGHRAWFVSDGARCYKSLARKFKLWEHVTMPKAFLSRTFAEDHALL